MGSFHFVLEKFDNVMYLQDMSKFARLKFKVGNKPYVLDQGMVVHTVHNSRSLSLATAREW